MGARSLSPRVQKRSGTAWADRSLRPPGCTAASEREPARADLGYDFWRWVLARRRPRPRSCRPSPFGRQTYDLGHEMRRPEMRRRRTKVWRTSGRRNRNLFDSEATAGIEPAMKVLQTAAPIREPRRKKSRKIEKIVSSD